MTTQAAEVPKNVAEDTQSSVFNTVSGYIGGWFYTTPTEEQGRESEYSEGDYVDEESDESDIRQEDDLLAVSDPTKSIDKCRKRVSVIDEALESEFNSSEECRSEELDEQGEVSNSNKDKVEKTQFSSQRDLLTHMIVPGNHHKSTKSSPELILNQIRKPVSSGNNPSDIQTVKICDVNSTSDYSLEKNRQLNSELRVQKVSLDLS